MMTETIQGNSIQEFKAYNSRLTQFNVKFYGLSILSIT
jgi:hypothetical protein